jgi:hypothetical protein
MLHEGLRAPMTSATDAGELFAGPRLEPAAKMIEVFWGFGVLMAQDVDVVSRVVAIGQVIEASGSLEVSTDFLDGLMRLPETGISEAA